MQTVKLGRNWLFSIVVAIAVLGIVTPRNAAGSSPAASPVEVHFSPNGGCRELLVAAINNATGTVYVLQYCITAEPLVKALLDAKARSVEVRVVLDYRMNAASKIPARLRTAGIPVKMDSSHAIMHNKILIVDRLVVYGGSYNWSDSAEFRNAENVVTIRFPEVVRAFIGNFLTHEHHSR